MKRNSWKNDCVLFFLGNKWSNQSENVLTLLKESLVSMVANVPKFSCQQIDGISQY